MPHCKLTECPIAKTGRCLENRGEECPNLLKDGEAAPPDASSGVAPSPRRAIQEPLNAGLALDLSEARRFSRRGQAVVVAVTGLAECGKTSLIARLHQMFLSGPIAGYRFMGSRTLLQFEEMNWRATVESGENAPRLERSPQLFDNSFLHFTVREADGVDGITDILLNDVSGETSKIAGVFYRLNARVVCRRIAV